MNIAFDTSVLIGLLDPYDLWHAQAVALRAALQSGGYVGVYFDCVLAETISTATRRLRERKRIFEIDAFLDRTAASFPPDSLTWASFDTSLLYSEILSLIRSSHGELNFNDALVGLSCRERGIRFIASFDSDFDRLAWLERLSQPGDVA
jgi:predicted nucleic acid-binding protein